MISAIILAGGLGTRLRSAVPGLPKPMAPIGGRPFLEHQFDYWITQGISHFVLSVGIGMKAIVRSLRQPDRTQSLTMSLRKPPLGTGEGCVWPLNKLTRMRRFYSERRYLFCCGLKTRSILLANDADWCFSLFRTNGQGRYMGWMFQRKGKSPRSIRTPADRHG